jgi:hypothetical protein
MPVRLIGLPPTVMATSTPTVVMATPAAPHVAVTMTMTASHLDDSCIGAAQSIRWCDLAFEFGARHQRGHRIDHRHIDRKRKAVARGGLIRRSEQN